MTQAQNFKSLHISCTKLQFVYFVSYKLGEDVMEQFNFINV